MVPDPVLFPLKVTFLQKMNENKSHSSKIEFVCSFFGGNVGLKKSFRFCLTFNTRKLAEVFITTLTAQLAQHMAKVQDSLGCKKMVLQKEFNPIAF